MHSSLIAYGKGIGQSSFRCVLYVDLFENIKSRYQENGDRRTPLLLLKGHHPGKRRCKAVEGSLVRKRNRHTEASILGLVQ